ncbi:hypothetical protein DAI22_05g253701 [Oryza sativa Japonica Group]|nr:hypothetical protein DAI22_05g253701 [Oryza sativa Japonica Group]
MESPSIKYRVTGGCPSCQPERFDGTRMTAGVRIASGPRRKIYPQGCFCFKPSSDKVSTTPLRSSPSATQTLSPGRTLPIRRLPPPPPRRTWPRLRFSSPLGSGFFSTRLSSPPPPDLAALTHHPLPPPALMPPGTSPLKRQRLIHCSTRVGGAYVDPSRPLPARYRAHVEDAGDHELAAAVGGGGGDDGGGAGVLIRRARAASRKRLETWRGVAVSFQILLRKFWLQLEVAGRERVDW